MKEKEIKETLIDSDDNQVYELGYHILPTVPPEDLPQEVSKIHSLISENGGQIIAEGAATLRQLAYEISKKIEIKNLSFNKAYFGWIKFEINRSRVEDLENKVKNLPNILRCLMVKTVKESTIHTPKIPMFKKETEKEGSEITEVAPKTPVSEAEIDKSIEDLLVTEN